MSFFKKSKKKKVNSKNITELLCEQSKGVRELVTGKSRRKLYRPKQL